MLECICKNIVKKYVLNIERSIDVTTVSIYFFCRYSKLKINYDIVLEKL